MKKAFTFFSWVSHPTRHAPRAISLFCNDQGNVLIVVGLAIFVLLGSLGSAVDMGRAQMAQAKLSTALDAAGLAAGGSLSSADVTATATSYFRANFPDGYMNVSIRDLTVTPNADNTVLTLSVQGDVPTTFMQLLGFESLAIGATSEITRANKGMELVLVMDVTGSMNDSAGGGVSKLAAAKTAANSLFGILYGTDTTADNLWIGLVPFSQAVNIGTSRGSWTSGSPNWGTSSWGGCVEARWSGGNDVTVTKPTTALFPKYYFPCNTTTNAWYGNNGSKNNCTTGGGGFGYKSPLNINLGPNKYCPTTPITPLTASRTTVENAINAMTATGGTEIVLGAVWGWRLLSPSWRGLWGGAMNTNNLPLDYNTPLMNKVVVLMSDGDNDIVPNYYSAYGYPTSGGLGANACVNSNCTNGENALNTRTAQVCTSMKNAGIVIYSVAFGSTISTGGQNLLKGCASKPEYYFYSPTGTDLQTAFAIIGDSLANLRVSK